MLRVYADDIDGALAALTALQRQLASAKEGSGQLQDQLHEAQAHAASLQRRVEENSELRLAICGGEDAPGYVDSLPLAAILKVAADNAQTARRDAELAWDGETATSWKARASQAEAALSEARGALTYVDQVLHILHVNAERGPSGHGKLMVLGSDEWRCVEKAREKVRQALQPGEKTTEAPSHDR
jgi:hypothetical protein